MTSQLTLYDSLSSPYAAKVRLALREKGIPFHSHFPTAAANPPSATSSPPPTNPFNPRLEVPILIDGSHRIFDSTIILEYIEDKWPDIVPLRPRDPAARAKARMIEDICDTHYEAINWGLGEVIWHKRVEGEQAEKMRKLAKVHTKEIQAWLTIQLEDGEGEYFNGEEFGIADIAVAPFLFRSVHWGLGPEPQSALGRWIERVKERSAVRETTDEYEKSIEGVEAYVEAHRSGGKKREYRDHRLEWIVKVGGIGVVIAGLKKENIRFSWPFGGV